MRPFGNAAAMPPHRLAVKPTLSTSRRKRSDVNDLAFAVLEPSSALGVSEANLPQLRNLRGPVDIDTVSLGLHQLRNILEPVELWALELCPTHIDLSVDPVCRMRLACQAAIGRVRHHGVEYRFCSLPCTAAFAADPDRYLDRGAS